MDEDQYACSLPIIERVSSASPGIVDALRHAQRSQSGASRAASGTVHAAGAHRGASEHCTIFCFVDEHHMGQFVEVGYAWMLHGNLLRDLMAKTHSGPSQLLGIVRSDFEPDISGSYDGEKHAPEADIERYGTELVGAEQGVPPLHEGQRHCNP